MANESQREVWSGQDVAATWNKAENLDLKMYLVTGQVST